MTECLWCKRAITPNISLFTLFSFQVIEPSYRCQSCGNSLEKLNQGLQCPCCARSQDKEEVCRDCERWSLHYSGHVLKHHSLFQYNDFFKEILSAYKYSCDYRLRYFFVEDLKVTLKPYLKTYSLVPIPISDHSFQKRGFNQTTSLLDAAALPYDDFLINENTTNQSLKTRKERMETPQYFKILEEARAIIPHQKYLLIDDVYTTGRTLYHARDLLLEAGAEEVLTFTLAR